MSIINEIPFGKHKLEVGLKLRESMLINGILTNIEVCYGMSDSEVKDLEKVDEYLLREIFKAHSKTPIESLYLETGVVPITFVIVSRRLSYLKYLLGKNDHELINKIYKAQRRKPIKNDWVKDVENDMLNLGITFTEKQIKEKSTRTYKKEVKEKIRKAALKELNDKKENHSKVKVIEYNNFTLQPYLSDSRFSMRDKQLLFKLRTKMLDVKANFKGMYPENLHCNICNEDIVQNQEHLLNCQIIVDNCSELFDNINVEHDDIYGHVDKQLSVVKLYKRVLEVRDWLQEEN